MNYKILHVDDDIIFSLVVKRILQRGGFEVYSASDGKSAWELFNKVDFNGCILDIVMPGMSGIELGQKIRAADNHIPIIFLSSEDPGSVMNDVLGRGGGNGYLSKCLSLKELTAVLNMHIHLLYNI